MNRNTRITVIVIYLFSLSLTKTTQAQSIDDLLSKIFTSSTPQPQPQSQPQPQPDVGGGKACGVKKECVERFLCDEDGAVVRNGETIIDIRFGDENSCNYLEVCCSTEEKLTQPNVPIKPAETHTGCGYRNPSGVGFRITGDKDGESQFGEFPWMAAILSEEVFGGETFNVYVCGGSIIAPNVVLTAAHCAQNAQPHLSIVRAGEWDTNTKQEVLPHQDARVKEIIRHENYNKGALYNDVALFILATPFTWAENVRPICLPEPDANFDYSHCFVTGWGKTKFDKEPDYPIILKKIELPTVPHDVCQANLRKTRLGRFFQLHHSFMCAGGEEGKDACIGDGGSPLVCPDPNNPKRYYQAGIVAWGIGCGAINVPGVYANVAYLRNWINTNLAARDIGFQHFTVEKLFVI